MTDKEALKLALEALEEAHYKMEHYQDEEKREQAITAIKEALAEHAMSKVQRLGQEIEQEPLEYWNAVEGWVKIDEVRKHFDSVGCGTIYKSAGEGRVPLCLAQPEQEPVVGITAIRTWYKDGRVVTQTLCNSWVDTTPPQRTWVGLTDEEYIHITDSVYHQGHGLVAYYKAIEAKLKEKNCG